MVYTQPRVPSSPPVIKPISDAGERPKWSVMIPAYNCSNFLPDALNSVLMQNISEEEMEIEVIDDASTDADVEEMVNRIGKGRIKYFRQPENVGSLRNFETCINRSRGITIHILHGDDRIKNGFYKKMGDLLNEYPEAGAAFCRYDYIDETGIVKFTREQDMDKDGILNNWLLRIAESCSIQYVSIVIKREIFEKLGAFYGLIYGEDWEMWVRMAQFYPFAYTPDVLAQYREHTSSITGVKFLNGGIMKDTRQVFRMIEDYLPASERASVIDRARKKSAHYGIQIAEIVWYNTRSVKYLNANVKQILIMCNTDKSVYKKVIKLYVKMAKHTIKNMLATLRLKKN